MADDDSKGAVAAAGTNSQAYIDLVAALKAKGNDVADFQPLSNEVFEKVMLQLDVPILDQGLVLRDFRKNFPLTNTATGGEMKISAGELAYAWLEEVKADNGSTPAPEQAYALYHEVAKVASGDSESQLLVKDLVNKQPKRAATPTAVQVAPWICVAASSGTGKTQLAVTARAYVDKVQPTKVVYLFMGALGEAQTFYRLHANLGMKIRREFGDKPFDKEGTSPHDLREGTSCKAYGLLRALLCETETLDKSVQPCSLSDLREAVWQLDKKLLVFLDEVPKRDAKDFRSCMVLRSVLRRIGVAPILMSTHTGSMDAVLTGSRQSGDVELFQESADYVLTLGKRRSVDVRVTISGVRPVATSVGKRRRERAHDQFNRRATKLRAVDLTSPSTDTSPDSGGSGSTRRMTLG